MNVSKPAAGASRIGQRIASATALLLVAAGLYIDAGTFHMMPGVGPCLSGLGVLLLPLGEGIASAAGPVEGILSLVFVVLAGYVAFRRRPQRRVEKGGFS